MAGFDLFYSLFDLEHRPRRRASTRGRRGSACGASSSARALLHVGDGRAARCGRARASTSASLYWLGVVAVAALLAYEHSLVRPGDLRRLDAAFFTVNGVISVVFFGFVLPTCS